MKVWVCLWTIALLSIASSSDLSANGDYSAIQHESDFYVDKITITNNINTSIQNITLKLPEDIKVFNFWQAVGDKYYLSWHTFPDNYTVTVKLEKPVEKVGILLMVYKREGVITGGSAATPDSVRWEGGQASPPQCEPEQCPVENQTVYVPVAQVRTEPQYNNVVIMLLLLAVIVMGAALTYDKVSSALGIYNLEESKARDFVQISKTLDDSPMRKQILSYIGGDGHMTNADLARSFRMDHKGMNKHMEKLLGAGLVEKEEKAGRKHKWYKLTDKGKRLVE